MLRYTFLACVALSALACDSDATSGGGGSGGSGVGGDGATGGSGAGNTSACVPHTTSADPDFSSPTGRFSLRVESTFVDFSGRVFDGAPGGFHTEIERSGACRLLGFEATNCSPDCEFGDFCIDSVCVASPSIIDAGSLTLTGVAPAPVMVMASDNLYYWSAEPAPNLAPIITLTNEGGDAGQFDLSVCVPPPLEPSTDWSQALEDRAPGASVTLTWSDPVPYARVYLRMTTGIGTHGGISPIEIECEGPDVGTLEIPGSYLDQLFEDGWSCGECGNNDLRRYVADEGDLSTGKARFTAETWSTFFFQP